MVRHLFEILRGPDGTEWYLKELTRIQGVIDELPADAEGRIDLDQEQRMVLATRLVLAANPMELSPPRITEVAAWRQQDSVLADVEKKAKAVTDSTGFMGFTSRTIALMSVSLLVCVVGIANAMLMSVTERFREIATMKCLGATDGFIMVNFILESCMQGIAGGVLGVILGVLLAFGRTAMTYKGMIFENLPVSELLATAGVSFVLGVIISALAAVYPAGVAARLAPMEAMRIE